MAKPYEALKAAELLAKLAGWNEPERTEHQHVHLAVDAGLIAQLRGARKLRAHLYQARRQIVSSAGGFQAGPGLDRGASRSHPRHLSLRLSRVDQRDAAAGAVSKVRGRHSRARSAPALAELIPWSS
jgi:hypothetical protein